MKNQKGIAHILLLIAAVGLIAFLLISNTFGFKDKLFDSFYPKPPSFAQDKNNSKEEAGIPVDLTGKLKVHVLDDFNNKSVSYRYWLTNENEERELQFSGKEPYEYAGKTVRIQGRMRDNKIILDSVDVPSEDAQLKNVLGTNRTVNKKTAVILFNFRNNSTEPFTPDWTKGVVFTNPNSVKAALKEMSFDQMIMVGKQSVDGDVFGWYTIDLDFTSCSAYAQYGDAAKKKATAAGVNLGGYDRIIYIHSVEGCSGVAELSGTNVWHGALQRQPAFTQSLAHEYMHTLGALHSNSLTCLDASGKQLTLSDRCSGLEYGSPYDIMGNALFYAGGSYAFPGPHSGLWHVNAIHKAKAGWLGTTNIQTVDSSGTYSLYPLEFFSNGTQLIRISKDRNGNTLFSGGHYYYLELRKRYGFDDYVVDWPAVNTVILYAGSDYKMSSAGYTLDMTPDSYPSSLDDFFDGGIGVGQTFEDIQAGIKITVTSMNEQKADVQITLSGSDTNPPRGKK